MPRSRQCRSDRVRGSDVATSQSRKAAPRRWNPDVGAARSVARCAPESERGALAASMRWRPRRSSRTARQSPSPKVWDDHPVVLEQKRDRPVEGAVARSRDIGPPPPVIEVAAHGSHDGPQAHDVLPLGSPGPPLSPPPGMEEAGYISYSCSATLMRSALTIGVRRTSGVGGWAPPQCVRDESTSLAKACILPSVLSRTDLRRFRRCGAWRQRRRPRRPPRRPKPG